MRIFPATRPEDVAVIREERDDGPREAFDRVAFAMDALALVLPQKTTVAVCGRSTRLRVDAGRVWGGKPGERWALVSVPETASRKAIALALSELADVETRPYVLDLLLARDDSHS